MNILALDLGTACGSAIFKDEKFISGTKKLGTYKEKFGARFHEFRTWLLNIIAKHNMKLFILNEFSDTKALRLRIATADFYICLHLCAFNRIFPA